MELHDFMLEIESFEQAGQKTAGQLNTSKESTVC
jgi:hypothetical protein